VSNQVTMTFAGDESKLVSSFNKVGAAADGMGTKVRSVSHAAQEGGSGVDNLTEKADGAEGKFIGFTDTISGLQGAMQGLSDPTLSMGEKLAVMGQAGADLAGGLAQFVIPALGGLWTKLMATSVAQGVLSTAQTVGTAITGGLTTAWGALNAVMRANPIMTVITIIALLVTAFVVLWNKSAGFRDFFIGMWNGIKNGVEWAVNGIKNVFQSVATFVMNVWNGVIGFFRDLPGKITGFFGNLGNGIKNIFKGAVNGIIDLLNGGIGLINGLIRGINNVSGVVGIPAIPQIPRIPRLHTGGVVPGVLGSEQLAILQAGERVIPRGQDGNQKSGTVEFKGDLDSAFAQYFMKLYRTGQIVIS
jgi:phage-related protein